MCRPPALDSTGPTPPPTRCQALLISPFYPKDARASFGKDVLTPSLSLSSIAAVAPPHWQVRFWDENLLQGPPPTDPFPQVVGITVHLTFAGRAYELADWYRRRGAEVVLGGLHVTSCPDEAGAHADAIAVGEGVQLWPRILRDIEAGTLAPRYHGSYHQPYRNDPPPRRDILPRESFLSAASLIATRGCHNRCGFCYLATDGLSMPYQRRDPADVVAEFLATGEPYGVFVDNNLGSNRGYVWSLCRSLRPARRIWSAAVSIDVADDPDLIREMALAGCTGVFIGFETLNMANLAAAGKRSPAPEDCARRAELFHQNGIQVNGSFVFGFDRNRTDVFERTIRWIESARLECATFHILTPYPNTPLFRQLERKGRLLHRDWSRYDTAHAVFRPKHMSPEELEAGYGWAYQRVFSLSSIWCRRPHAAGQVLSYLAMSLLYKKCNRLWPMLIRYRLTHALWRPLIELSRRRHLRFRKSLCGEPTDGTTATATPVPAGV
jgi:radical SAM superfamily enzyme YgiQ (UPF0313 family)